MKILRELIEVFRADAKTKNIPRASGIYQIRCVPTGKIYVGRAVNLYSRWCDHQRNLRQGKHHNVNLQKAWDECGEKNFEFLILELAQEQELISREQEWIDQTNCTNRSIGFNISDDASYPSGMHAQVWEGFIDPDGNEVVITNLHEFRRQNGLNVRVMLSLTDSKTKHKGHKGWTHKNSVRQRDYIKTWEGFVDPNGNAVGTITNLAAFCREHSL